MNACRLPGSPWLMQAPELLVFCATVDAAIVLGAFVSAAGLALGYPEAKEAMSARLAMAATVHEDGYDKEAVEKELDAYDARRGKDWSGDKVNQYSKVMRADFGAHVARKRYRLI